MLVSIDPGVKLAGVAVWDNNELTTAWLAKGKDWADLAGNILSDLYNRYPDSIRERFDLAIEKPKIYHQSKQKGDQRDIIELAMAVGAIVTCVAIEAKATIYEPHEWKGSTPKDIMIVRIKEQISPEEHTRITLPSAKSLRHNVFDAIGIGLHHLRKQRRK